jgi:hypothetical protein
MEGADYVLQKPTAEDRTAIEAAIARSLEVLPLCLSGDMQTAMHKLHTEETPKKVAEKASDAAPVQAPVSKQPEKPGLLKSLFGKK